MINQVLPVSLINVYKCLAIFAAVSFYEFTRKFQYTIFQYSEKIRFGKFGERENKSCDVFFFGRNLGFCSLLVKLVLSLVKTVPREPRGLDHEQVTGDNSQLVNLGLKSRTGINASHSLQLGELSGENSVLGERMTNGDGGICISSSPHKYFASVPTNTLH